MAKAKIFSLETELSTLKNKSIGVESDMRMKNDEIMDLHSRNVSLLKELKEKDELLDVAKAKEESFEEVRNKLEGRVT